MKYSINENYFISDDKNLLDLDIIHHYLSKESYWAEGIPKSVVAASIKGSVCFGVYSDKGLVGFARVITDFATFGYLADVFILAAHRGKGLSKILMVQIMTHPDLQGLRVILLGTRDAHGLYEKFDFAIPEDPRLYMRKTKANFYKID